MNNPMYAIYVGRPHFTTYNDSRVPHPVRKVCNGGDLVLVTDGCDGVLYCELADGTQTKVMFMDVVALPHATIGHEASFKTPEYGDEPEQVRSGTIIEVLTGRQFGHVLVQGNEQHAYLVHVNDILAKQ